MGEGQKVSANGMEIGDEVKDTITGFTGTVTGIWFSGTQKPRLLVETIDSANRPVEWWVDVDRCKKQTKN